MEIKKKKEKKVEEISQDEKQNAKRHYSANQTKTILPTNNVTERIDTDSDTKIHGRPI